MAGRHLVRNLDRVNGPLVEATAGKLMAKVRVRIGASLGESSVETFHNLRKAHRH